MAQMFLQEMYSSHGAYNDQEHRVKGSEIFVGGLSRSTTENMIREMFSPYGEIIELRMMKDQNGTSKGFCFVRFATKEAAVKAQKEKDGIMYQGGYLSFTKGGTKQVHGKKIGVAPSSDQDSLFFGNLRKDWSSEEFGKLVHQAFTDIVSVDLALTSSTEYSPLGKKRLNRGFAIVQFSSHSAAARAFRIGSKPDFLLGGDWHPVIDWAEKEPEIDPEELAKIKVAFVGNLPTNADEDFLKKLFEQFGKVDRVALSRKGHFPVGFVHFANRFGLDNAIREMDGRMVQGPQKGPKFKIQVSVARPVENDRKRVRDEVKSRPLIKFGVQPSSLNDRHTNDSLDPKSKAPRLGNVVPEAVDPYEEAVIALPSAVKERLLRVLRLGVATRYDVDIHCIASLQELPESAAIAVLDQFILSGAEKRDKAAYFASLVARHQGVKLESRWNPSHIPRKDNASNGSELLSLRAPLHSQAINHSAARYSNYTSSASIYPYSSPFTEDPGLSRSSLGKLGETASSYRDPLSSTLGHGAGAGSGSLLASSADRLPERPQMRFDPFTGQPYKFDPFTGEPIRPESHPRHSASHF